MLLATVHHLDYITQHLDQDKSYQTPITKSEPIIIIILVLESCKLYKALLLYICT